MSGHVSLCLLDLLEAIYSPGVNPFSLQQEVGFAAKDDNKTRACFAHTQDLLALYIVLPNNSWHKID